MFNHQQEPVNRFNKITQDDIVLISSSFFIFITREKKEHVNAMMNAIDFASPHLGLSLFLSNI